ncbi:MAG: 30S ribosomal protein S1 [Firmicutes bacterium HGW-Firmicutes-1]|jgi:ribosomal protein S1|nr:MAG: 30S ribosomal protein S1 [Firmicutes bacterium HGW-Firmicutes-1]
MSEEQSFEQMLEESLIAIRRGEVIEGTVIGVNDDEIYVNIGYKSDGIIPKSEFSNFPSVSLRDSVKEGDKIRAKVLKVNDGEGQVLLTYKRLQTEEGLKKVEKLCKSKEEVTGKVSLVLEGGLIVIIDEVRVFIPASLVSDSYVTDLQAYKNQEITFVITEVNQKKNRIIGNRRILLEHEKNILQAETFKTLAEGAVLNGEVKNITDYGVFVNLKGVDGLVHISELSWGRVKSPKDVVKVGDIVKVKVISINMEKKKVSLTMKFPEDNPWNNAEQKYAVGNVVEGRVARMTEFGAFIELEVGVDALLHVSQISVKHIEKPKDILKIGQTVTAKVTELDLDGKKISLSIKALESDKEVETEVQETEVQEIVTPVETQVVDQEEPQVVDQEEPQVVEQEEPQASEDETLNDSNDQA